MLKTDNMCKVSVIAPKAHMEKIIEGLYSLKLCHIIDHKKTENLDICEPLDRGEKISEALVRIRAVISYLDIKPKKQKKTHKTSNKELAEINSKSKKIYDKTTKELEIIKDSKSKISEIEKKIDVLSSIKKLNIKATSLKDTKSVDYIIGTIDNVPLDKYLSNITKRYKLIAIPEGKRKRIALFFEKENKEKMMELLGNHAFAETDLEPIRTDGKIKDNMINDLKKDIRRLESKISQSEKNMEKIRKDNSSFLIRTEYRLTEETKKTEVPLKFATTSKSFMINGWIPAKKAASFKETLNIITNNKIHITISEPEKKEEPPVRLRHSGIVRPFEFLTKLYDLPKYKEIDPTWLIFLTFPIFFGLMLGDVGYGLVTLILWFVLKKFVPSLRVLLNIMIFTSIMTIIFGFAFGEYFGFEHVSYETGKTLCLSTGICLPIGEIDHGHGEAVKVSEFPRVMNRAHGEMNIFGFEILSILVIGAIIGFVHVNIGLLIGFYNALCAHGLKHAIFEKISWIVLEAGVILLVVSLAGIMNIPSFIGIIVMALSVVMLFIGEGAKGLIELPAIFTNILSYMRLGAVGLASVGLAVVINENLAMPFFEKGGLGILAAIMILIFGHAINIALGTIGPFLHSIRLHYVEFFGKFYEGGGQRYSPFGEVEEK